MLCSAIALHSLADIGLIHLEHNDVLLSLIALDISKGPDKFSLLCLKFLAQAMAILLLIVFQKPLSFTQFPCRWKTSCITPAFKSGSREYIGNEETWLFFQRILLKE